MASYLVQEDGTSKILLEGGSSDALLLETSTPTVTPTFIASVSTVYAPTVAYAGAVPPVKVAGTYQWLCPSGIDHTYVECVGGAGGGGGGNTFTVGGGGGGGGGAYSARVAVPVTPGTLYTFVVGAGGASIAADNPQPQGHNGGDSTFTGDSSVQVIAKGGTGGLNNVNELGGQASGCTGDTGLKFSGGNGGQVIGGGNGNGGGGGAAGNRLANGANGADSTTGGVGAGGTGANGGGSGGTGGLPSTAGNNGSAPGGGGGGGGSASSGAAGADGAVIITPGVVAPFISSVTTLYGPTVSSPSIAVPFIASVTVLYAPDVTPDLQVPFISSVSVVYTPSLPEVQVPFISSNTHVFRAFSLFNPNRTFGGPGNGGEGFLIRLAPNGSSVTATLTSSITAAATALSLTGDSGLPTDTPFTATIDAEVVYLSKTGPGVYQIRLRGLSNTIAASHTAGATVDWGDSYEQAIIAAADIAHDFTADINSQGSHTYPGWLVAYDATQAYLSGSRYPFHVTELVGVFDADTGETGTNRLDASQPNAICTPTGTSDGCPAALSNPARINSDIATGDVAIVRYTNPEATVLDLGPRSVSLQSWFGLKRVDTSDNDVTFTNPNGIVIDTTGTYDTFTGSVNDEWHNPSAIGIGPDTGTPTPNPVPYTTVTLPGTDRYFTDGSHYSEKGWPFGVLTVRQGNRRVPFWQSYDWHNFSYVYNGFGTDCTFAQIVVNRNGVLNNEPEVVLPGPQDISGPDAVWDDGTYYFAASWYVAIFNGPYLVIGPTIGGLGPGITGWPTDPPVGVPSVTFPPGGGTPTVTVPEPPVVEGGSGGGIGQPVTGLHVWQTS